MNCGAVIVGAGRGERVGLDRPKCLYRINDVPLILLSAWSFEQAANISEIVLVVPPGSEKEILTAVTAFVFKRIKIVVRGGEKRQDSVFAGVSILSTDIERVLIHDGARALVSRALIERVLTSLETEKAVLAAVPVTDTLHLNIASEAERGPDRNNLVAAQTPQGFRTDLLLKAFIKCKESKLEFSDEASMVRELLDINIKLVPGEAKNLKITRTEDLELLMPALEERAMLVNRRREC